MPRDCKEVSKGRRRRKKLVIRYIRKSDRRCASHIDESCFHSSPSEFKPGADEKIIVATQAGEIVGYIRFDIADDHVYIANVCVADNARGEGICKKMCKWLIRKLDKLERDRIELWAANDVAAQCYASVGFVGKDHEGDSSMVYRHQPRRRRAKECTTC